MSQLITVYFTCISPFSYLGHSLLGKIAQKHQLSLQLKPVILPKVWESSGGVPLNQRPAARVAYRSVELQRWSEARNISLQLHPKYFPTSPALADKVVIALQEQGGPAFALAEALMKACWAEDQNIAEEAVITTHLQQLGCDAAAILEQAQSKEIQQLYDANTQEAITNNVIGAPAYFYKGEQFWGQDRLDLLDAMITSDRKPYS
jgi:2-hydroxychromene-2-carboxylate isomerase